MTMDRTHLTWIIAIVAVTFAQWLFFAARQMLAPKRAKLPILISSGVLFAAWLGAFLPPLLAQDAANKSMTEAAMTLARKHGSCAGVQPKDSAASVAKKIGTPDEKI